LARQLYITKAKDLGGLKISNSYLSQQEGNGLATQSRTMFLALARATRSGLLR
jgi:hypothetical protein